MSSQREPSMEDILASIKKVIAEEKELRAAVPSGPADDEEEGDSGDEDVLELDQPMGIAPPPPAPPEPEADPGPPLIDDDVADDSRARLAELSSIAAAAPPTQPAANPLEDIVRDMLRPALKAWLDEHLPRIVDEHVKREISRITGKPL